MAQTQNAKVLLARAAAAEQAELRYVDGTRTTVAMTIEVDADTREMVVTVDPHAKGVRFVNADIKPVPPMHTHKAPAEDGITRNWKVEDGKFVVWLPNGAEVTLPVAAEPGPFTPRGVPEVYGQGDLLFTMALALKTGKHNLLMGPTGTGKTTMVRWLAEKLNYNYVLMACGRSTESAHLIGEYMPTADPAQPFGWVDGPVTKAVRVSQQHPTILLFDEMNRIGNVAEFARIYSLLDDQRVLELPEKRNGTADAEVIPAGNLYVIATANPAEDEAADYIGVQELDPALSSRFSFKPRIGYPPAATEARALVGRVVGLDIATASKMVAAANRIRTSPEVRFPISFRELEAWALSIPFRGYADAAEDTVVNSAPLYARPAVRNLLSLQG